MVQFALVFALLVLFPTFSSEVGVVHAMDELKGGNNQIPPLFQNLHHPNNPLLNPLIPQNVPDAGVDQVDDGGDPEGGL